MSLLLWIRCVVAELRQLRGQVADLCWFGAMACSFAALQACSWWLR